jgi:hypothetical protein
MKAKKLSRFALCSVVVLAIAVVSFAAVTSVTINPAKGGPPVITNVAVALNPAGVTCGVEITCARVSWTATVPVGTTVSGIDVELKVTKDNGQVETNKKSVGGGETHADMAAAFQSGTPKSYVVTVTANYTSVAIAGKNGTF